MAQSQHHSAKLVASILFLAVITNHHSHAAPQVPVGPAPGANMEHYISEPESGDGSPGNPFIYKLNQGQGLIVKAPQDLLGFQKVSWQSLGGPQKGPTTPRTAQNQVLLTLPVVTLLDVGYHKATVTTLSNTKVKYFYNFILRGFDDYFIPEKGDGSKENPYHYKLYEGDSGKISCLAGYPIADNQVASFKENQRAARVDTPSETGRFHDEAIPLQSVTMDNAGTYRCTIVETVDGVQSQTLNESYHEIDVFTRPRELVPVEGKGTDEDPFVYQVNSDTIGTISFHPMNQGQPDAVVPTRWYFTSNENPTFTPVAYDQIVHTKPYLKGLQKKDSGTTFRCKSLIFEDQQTHHLIEVCDNEQECALEHSAKKARIPPVAHPDDDKYGAGVAINPWEFTRKIGENINIACAYRKNKIQGYSIQNIRWLKSVMGKETEFQPDQTTHIVLDENLAILDIQQPDYAVYICERYEDKQGLVRYYHKIVDPNAKAAATTAIPPYMLKTSDPVRGTGTQLDPWVHAIDEHELLYAACKYQNPDQASSLTGKSPGGAEVQAPYDRCSWSAVVQGKPRAMTKNVLNGYLFVKDFRKKFYNNYTATVEVNGVKEQYFHEVIPPKNEDLPIGDDANKVLDGDGTHDKPFLHVGRVGGHLQFPCNPIPDGDEESSAQWFVVAADGTHAEVPGEQTTFPEGELFIESLQKANEGTYACTIEEAEASEEQTLYHKLLIQDAKPPLDDDDAVAPAAGGGAMFG